MTLPRLPDLLFAGMCLFGLGSPALAKIDANISFAPAVINAGATARATVTLQNSDITAATATTFAMNMPDGMLKKGTGNLSSSCSGSLDLSTSDTILGLGLVSGTIPAASGGTPGSCVISFDVTAHRAVVLTTTIPIGAVSSTVGGTNLSNTTSAQATLTSTMTPLGLTNSSSLGNQFQGGETGWRNFKITNPNAVAVTELYFPIDMSLYGDQYAALDLISNSCGGAYSRTTLTTSLSSNYENFTQAFLTGATIPANSSCDLRFAIKPLRILRFGYVSLGQSTRIPAGVMTSTQSVSNAISNDHWTSFRAGMVVDMLVNGATSSTLDVASGEIAEITYLVQNYNIVPVPNASVKITIPSGLNVVSYDGGSCGSLSPVSGGLQYNFTQSAAPAQIDGYQTGDCLARIQVRATASGNFSISSSAGYTGTAPYGTTYFAGDSVAISANASMLEVVTGFDKTQVYASDTSIFTVKLTNKSAILPVEDIQLTNRIGASIYGAIIGSSGLISNSCGGSVVIPLDRSQISLSGINLDASGICEMSWQIHFGSASYKGTGVDPRTYGNSFSNSDISYRMPNGTRQDWAASTSSYIDLLTSLYVEGSFSPSIASKNSISRLRFKVTKYSHEGHGLRDIWTNINLSGGIKIAPQPNFSSTCGGKLDSLPGDVAFKASNGSLSVPIGSSFATCSFYVDTIMPDMANGAPVQIISSSIYGETMPATRRSYGAQDIDIDGFAGESYNSWGKSAAVQVGSYNLDLGLTFADASLGGSGSTRVAVTLSSLSNIGLNLTNISLPIDLAGSGLKLAASPDPKFTVKTGSSSACSGAQFTAAPGSSFVEIHSAKISAQAECIFEFTVSATGGGSHTISIPALIAKSSEGVTNTGGVSATVIVGYMLSGGIGFTPNLIGENGLTDLSIEIVNTNPDEPGNGYTGGTPAISYNLPPYAVPAGLPNTTCPGGTVSFSGNILRLDGGDFPPSSICSITLPVSITGSGSYNADLAAGAIRTSDTTTNLSAASATIKVLKAPILTLNSVSSMTGIGRIGSITAKLTNPNTSTLNPGGLSGLSFSIGLAADLSPVEAAISSSCGGFTYNLQSTDFTAQDITLAAGSSCNVTLPMSSAISGLHSANIGNLGLADFDITAPADITASLRFAVDPTVTLRTTGPAPDSEIPFRFETEIANPNNFPVGLTSFTLPLPASPAALTLASPSALLDCGPAAATGVIGSASMGMTSGTLPAHSSCLLSADIVTPKGGAYTFLPAAMQLEYGSVSIAPTVVAVQGTSAALRATRTLRVIADHVADLATCASLDPAENGSRTLPGACVEVLITIENPITEIKTARNFSAREVISSNMSLASRDTGDLDGLTEDASGLLATLSSLAPGESASFSYRGVLQ